MISPDALVVAGATIAVLGLQQLLMHRQNRRDSKEWIRLLSYILEEYPLHRHEKDNSISYPKVKLKRPPNGKIEFEHFT